MHRAAQLSRRALIAAAVLIPLSACSAGQAKKPVPTASVTAPAGNRSFAALEEQFDARLGLWAFDTGSKREVVYRQSERFAFCSTSKPLAIAALLSSRPQSYLDTVIRFSAADILSYAPITKQHVATGMTVRELCDAAIRFSDNTAENLILREVGGPAEVTSYLRTIGDAVTRFDRTEPTLNTAIPADPRDTTSPRAIGTDLQKLLLGTSLRADTRASLTDWMLRNTTSTVPALSHIRAGVPAGWKVADKTGSGSYGSVNDIAVAWPPGRAPIVISVLTTRPLIDDVADSALIARATAVAVGLLAA